MDSLYTEFSNCQFFQSNLMNLMRALQEELVHEVEQPEPTLPDAATPPVV